MQRPYFLSHEHDQAGQTIPISEFIGELAFNEHGLIPVIAQDTHSKTVLMMAWMNREAIQQTLASGHMTYWSRSRQQLWIKGATSGHHQRLISMRFDCDGDAILCEVAQTGGACHTLRKHCFYFATSVNNQHVTVTDDTPNTVNHKG